MTKPLHSQNHQGEGDADKDEVKGALHVDEINRCWFSDDGPGTERGAIPPAPLPNLYQTHLMHVQDPEKGDFVNVFFFFLLLFVCLCKFVFFEP